LDEESLRTTRSKAEADDAKRVYFKDDAKYCVAYAAHHLVSR